MHHHDLSERDADEVNARMAIEIEQRRLSRPDRRLTSKPFAVERRATCMYCFQRGQHPTPAHCLRALERTERQS
jgi:hypothetical protein